MSVINWAAAWMVCSGLAICTSRLMASLTFMSGLLGCRRCAAADRGAVRQDLEACSGLPLRFEEAIRSSSTSLIESTIDFDAPFRSRFFVSPRLAEREIGRAHV